MTLRTQFDRAPLRKGLLTLLFVAIIAPGFASPSSARSRIFDGVTANFEVKNPIVKSGEDLKIVVVYRNTSNRTVSFRFGHLDEDAEVYGKGKSKPIVGGYVGEFPYETITLKAGERYRFEDYFTLRGWPDLAPGDYQIRFCYHLGLLRDESLIKKYQAIYPHDGYIVPWSEHRYAFTLIK